MNEEQKQKMREKLSVALTELATKYWRKHNREAYDSMIVFKIRMLDLFDEL